MPVKPGVSMRGVRLEIVFAMAEARAWCERLGLVFTVTSCIEGNHSKNSLHYSGLAFDMRTRDMTPAQKTACRLSLAEALGEQYDVVLESSHLHIEFDPK